MDTSILIREHAEASSRLRRSDVHGTSCSHYLTTAGKTALALIVSICLLTLSAPALCAAVPQAAASLVQAIAEPVPAPAISAGGIWLRRLTLSKDPPQTRLAQLVQDDEGSTPDARRLVLSPAQSDFSIAFSALSFTSPDTNRYRYRLDGLETAWHDGALREVSYMALPQGSYRLEVQAATSRGQWAEPGAAFDIEVLPPWWKGLWFRITYTAAFGILLAGAYRYRIVQIARQYEMRSKERVSERTRIARELHDSLLQGFHGLMFRLQAVRDLLPDNPDEAIAQLETALDRGDQAILEARDAVQELRASPFAHTELAQDLALLGDEFIARNLACETALKVLVEGRPRTLDPVIRDELYRIAREALRNAFQHSNGSRIECELNYGNAVFRIRVRDDGQGIEPAVLETGTRTGHWGLVGMRERVEKFGGTLTIWSAKKTGTEIEVSVPAKVTYA